MFNKSKITDIYTKKQLVFIGNEPNNGVYTMGKFRCRCGKVFLASIKAVKYGTQVSCGCVRKARSIASCTIHGATNTKEFNAWRAMQQRCYNKNSPAYKYYGARGICVSKRWRLSFVSFLKDMGLAPSKEHSIERKNNNGNYTKSNCIWATSKTQVLNRRNNVTFKYNGEVGNLEYWCAKTSINKSTIVSRLYTGKWNIWKAITTPIRNKNIKQ